MTEQEPQLNTNGKFVMPQGRRSSPASTDTSAAGSLMRPATPSSMPTPQFRRWWTHVTAPRPAG